MLFNSYIFIGVFLPFALFGFYLLSAYASPRMAKVWLVAASLFYYGWWNPSYLWLIVGSALFNYSLGRWIQRTKNRRVLIFGIVINIALLGYFKYANFFIENLNSWLGAGWILGDIILPLAISFFTFQQISYLVDIYKGEIGRYSFTDYLLFVTFFPQLIAGPIVHPKEMMPQFAQAKTYRFSWENMAAGLTCFAMGLGKKVLIADSLSPKVLDVFNALSLGKPMHCVDAWAGPLAYAFQIYFDFSGYSDMAIGLGFLFGITLPLNFNSPYKATSMIEFWHRWHITLSCFLRDYLYIPLGGNRQGAFSRYRNLMVTMLIGGFWHGAAWTFVAWGLLHGTFLVLNHGFLSVQKSTAAFLPQWLWTFVGRTLTLLAVVIAWVFFRVDNLGQALALLNIMIGQGQEILAGTPTLLKTKFFYQLLLLIPFTWFLPNTQELLAAFRPRPGVAMAGVWSRFTWGPSLGWAMVTFLLLATSVLSFSKVSEFLYYQF